MAVANNGAERGYVPALGRLPRAFGAYDAIVRWTMRDRAVKARLLADAELTAEVSDVLDVGCGTGTFALAVAGAAPWATVLGVDGDASALAVAESKAARRSAPREPSAPGVGVRFAWGLATALPVADACMDRAFSSLVFHHLGAQAKRRAAAEVRRVLRPGGTFHLCDWGAPSGPAMRAAFRVIEWTDGRATTAENRTGALPGILREAGFTDVRETAAFDTAFGTIRLWAGRR